jgi:hypothetical protein
MTRKAAQVDLPLNYRIQQAFDDLGNRATPAILDFMTRSYPAVNNALYQGAKYAYDQGSPYYPAITSGLNAIKQATYQPTDEQLQNQLDDMLHQQGLKQYMNIGTKQDAAIDPATGQPVLTGGGSGWTESPDVPRAYGAARDFRPGDATWPDLLDPALQSQAAPTDPATELMKGEVSGLTQQGQATPAPQGQGAPLGGFLPLQDIYSEEVTGLPSGIAPAVPTANTAAQPANYYNLGQVGTGDVSDAVGKFIGAPGGPMGGFASFNTPNQSHEAAPGVPWVAQENPDGSMQWVDPRGGTLPADAMQNLFPSGLQQITTPAQQYQAAQAAGVYAPGYGAQQKRPTIAQDVSTYQTLQQPISQAPPGTPDGQISVDPATGNQMIASGGRLFPYNPQGGQAPIDPHRIQRPSGGWMDPNASPIDPSAFTDPHNPNYQVGNQTFTRDPTAYGFQTTASASLLYPGGDPGASMAAQPSNLDPYFVPSGLTDPWYAQQQAQQYPTSAGYPSTPDPNVYPIQQPIPASDYGSYAYGPGGVDPSSYFYRGYGGQGGVATQMGYTPPGDASRIAFGGYTGPAGYQGPDYQSWNYGPGYGLIANQPSTEFANVGAPGWGQSGYQPNYSGIPGYGGDPGGNIYGPATGYNQPAQMGGYGNYGNYGGSTYGPTGQNISWGTGSGAWGETGNWGNSGAWGETGDWGSGGDYGTGGSWGSTG